MPIEDRAQLAIPLVDRTQSAGAQMHRATTAYAPALPSTRIFLIYPVSHQRLNRGELADRWRHVLVVRCF